MVRKIVESELHKNCYCKQRQSYTAFTTFFFENFTLAGEVLVNQRLLEATVQGSEGHTASRAVHCVLVRGPGILAHKVAELQIHTGTFCHFEDYRWRA